MNKTAIALVLAAAALNLLPATDADAKIRRSTAALNAFKRTHACPANGIASTKSCPGYVIDHITPLDCGGPDKPENMQWQTVADAKAKDKWERKGCKKGLQ